MTTSVNGFTDHPVSEESPACAAALGYARRGWKVVRLYHTLADGTCSCGDNRERHVNSRGKHPIHSDWQEYATTDEEIIEREFAHREHANIGVQMGPQSLLIDMECDSPKAEETLTWLFDGEPPMAPTFKANRGKHRLFKYRADLPRKSNIKIGELEIRTGNGEPKPGKKESGQQSVFPPSVRHLAGGKIVRYEWLPGCSPDDVDPPEIPDKVLARIVNLDGEDEVPAGDQPPGAVSLETLQDAINHLNQKRFDNYQGGGWLDIGMALFHASAGSEEGLNLWDEASKQSAKYEPGGCAEKWKTFSTDGGGKKLTVGSLFWWAKLDSPGWKPPKRAAGESGPYSFLTNADLDEDGEWKLPRTMRDILGDVERLTNSWPRRVGTSLFAPSHDGITWLESPDALFGWIGSITKSPARFSKAVGMHSRSEVFAELCRTSTAHIAVETLIHEPPLPGHYYAVDHPEVGDGTHLRWLIDRYSPDTDIDRDLIQAALMTSIWGGAGGTRPAFVITADQGRGSGKTKTVSTIAEVPGGLIELSANEDAGVIRQRLLSPEGLSKRVCIIDNVKSMRFSWAELESMITASVISGKRMYVGEAQRPNTLTWFVTLNGVSLSTDLAQRSVIIKLKKPVFDPLWEETTRAYIREHRNEIIGDLVAALRADRTPLQKYSRWNAWERDVLSRLPEPAEAQKIIAERQQVADVESEESAIIEDAFRWKLRGLRYDPDIDRIFIPSTIAAKWLSDILNDRLSTTAASRRLGQFVDEGAFECLTKSPSRTHGRGFYWCGQESSPSDPARADIEHRIADQGRRDRF